MNNENQAFAAEPTIFRCATIENDTALYQGEIAILQDTLAIRISIGGLVFTKTAQEWHNLAKEPHKPPEPECPTCNGSGHFYAPMSNVALKCHCMMPRHKITVLRDDHEVYEDMVETEHCKACQGCGDRFWTTIEKAKLCATCVEETT